MELIWTEHSKADLQNFSDNIHEGTDKSANNYILNLIDYVTLLKDNPYMGKTYSQPTLIDMKQLIYRKHKIFYTIIDNTILILAVVHSSRNMDNFSKNFLVT